MGGFVFSKMEWALRHVFDSREPFGGVHMILVGDFDQKLPVERGSSLAEILVNQTTYQERRIDKNGTRQQHAADLFGMFKKYEMTENHRLEGDQEKLKRLLREMRDTSVKYPITVKFLKSLPQLRVPPHMFEEQRAA